MKASIIICTHNRSEMLRDVVESLQAQDFKGEFEIIIVDNNSTDNTKEVVKELGTTSSVPIRYTFEKQQGLSHARNKGIEVARGEIVAFLDDDSVGEKSWLSSLMPAYDDGKVGCVGGRLKLMWLAERPDWLPSSLEGFLGKLDYGDSPKELKYPEIPFGGNISFRKSIFEGLEKFSPKLGRDGKTLLSNEELELCARIEKQGWRLRYIPTAIVHHKVTPERLKKLWFYHRRYYQGKSDAVLDLHMKTPLYSRLRKYTAVLLKEVKDSENEFENKCLDRQIKGYLHHFLFHNEQESGERFRKIRVIETLLSATVDQMKRVMEQRRQSDEQLRQTMEQRKQGDEQLRDVSMQLTAKQGQLTERDEQLRQAHERLRQRNERLAEQDQQLKQEMVRTNRLQEQLESFRVRIEQLEALIRKRDE